MAYTLPALPYDFKALEPHIDALTMEIHHGRHHNAYVTNLNAALQGAGVAEQSIEHLCANLASVPDGVRMAVRNNGGGHANHSLFWITMSPTGGGEPTGALADAINKELGGFAKFKEDFTQNGLKRFGSGWSWISVTPERKLMLESTPNQDNPWMEGRTPILGCDVWEHAYYLKYQNKRPDYMAAFFNVIDWAKVGELYLAAIK